MSKEQKFDKVFKKIGKDFKGLDNNGDKSVMLPAAMGFGIASVKQLTDEQVETLYKSYFS